MKTILFFGAGVSVNADYPDTSSLLNAIEANHYSKNRYTFVKNYLKKSHPSIIEGITDTNNIELLLTFFDLIIKSGNSLEEKESYEIESKLGSGAVDWNKLFSILDDKQFKDAKKFQYNLNLLVGEFFEIKNFCDNEKNNFDSRSYIKKLFPIINHKQ